MTLEQWAIRWGVAFNAIAELRQVFGEVPDVSKLTNSGNSEASVLNDVRLEASKKGIWLSRNNVGACQDTNGNFIRYGLANESAQMNKKIKSSDLIGVKPVLIEQKHVGVIFGQFVARETKVKGWEYSGSEREQAQLKFIQLIVSMGGDAMFTTGAGSL